jgi:hypothetical protein
VALVATALSVPQAVGGLAARPDLRLASVHLRTVDHVAIPTVTQGQPYKVCFRVRNIGTVNSGPYRVAGGGLGIPTNPFADYPGVSAGGARSGCLRYPTTPRAGSYNLGIQADATNIVVEMREDNNNAVIPVTVVP